MEQIREVQLSEFSQSVAEEAIEANETIVVKCANNEVGRFIPAEKSQKITLRTPGRYRGKLVVGEEFFAPLPDDMQV